jgi:signal transduction histidine kinase
MGRSLKIWGAFLLFVLVVLGAMGWVSTTVLRLKAETVAAQRDAQVEDVVRLALWRMDTAAMAMVIEESSRPYQDYWAFNDGNRPVSQFEQQGQQVAASPLLEDGDGLVNVYFNGWVTPDSGKQTLSSPQVPSDQLQEWALSNYNVAATLPEKSKQLSTLNSKLQIDDLAQALVENESREANPSPPPEPQPVSKRSSSWSRGRRSDQEFKNRRSQTTEAQYRIKGQNKARYEAVNNPNILPPISVTNALSLTTTQMPAQQVAAIVASSGAVPDEGIMRPVWVNDLLILGRNVTVQSNRYVQGAWLNWENVKSNLLSEVHDILPQADLQPVTAPIVTGTSRLLAVLPARLDPGTPAGLPAISVPSLRVPLSLAWIGVLISVAAVAALLLGVVRLSERRGAFVSAVTHELRTPLTTFKMYTEMLAEGLIKDPVKQQDYLNTLHSESNRLSHLVENVLAYARLERGPGSRVIEPLTVAALLDRSRDPLLRRAAEVGMDLVIEEPSDGGEITVRSDIMAVGQILFNLVDNACKYAAKADDKRIHLTVSHDARHLVLCVCDHGSGLKPSESRIVFRPFRKSAQRAARTAPGVGLGLALCKSLARQLGGDIAYAPRAGYGACFRLRLPR